MYALKVPPRKREPPPKPDKRAAIKPRAAESGRAGDTKIFGVAACSVLLEAVKLGASQSDAARALGVSPRTVRAWLERGRKDNAEVDRWRAGDWPDGKPPPERTAYGLFVEEWMQAQADPRFVLLRMAWEALRAIEDPKARFEATLKFLERIAPADYSAVANVRTVSTDDETGERVDSAPGSAVLTKLEEQVRRIEAIEAAARGGA